MGGAASPAGGLGEFLGHSCVFLLLKKGHSQAGRSYFRPLFLGRGFGQGVGLTPWACSHTGPEEGRFGSHSSTGLAFAATPAPCSRHANLK